MKKILLMPICLLWACSVPTSNENQTQNVRENNFEIDGKYCDEYNSSNIYYQIKKEIFDYCVNRKCFGYDYDQNFEIEYNDIDKTISFIKNDIRITFYKCGEYE